MRYVIYGSGAIGGSIGARLQLAGRSVAFIARGEHLEALRTIGLRFQTPLESTTLAVEAFGSPQEVGIREGDTVILGMKTQDTAAALDDLARVAPSHTPIVCAQNGVENERLALRRFDHVYAMLVILPAEHLEPGVVRSFLTPIHGVLDLGRYPGSEDALSRSIAADLTASGFSATALGDIMRWKYRKLLRNLGNIVEAACGPAAAESPEGRRLCEGARKEGLACLQAAGIAVASDEELSQRTAGVGSATTLGVGTRSGGSTWQSLSRGGESLETPWLNGEVCLLGRLHALPTPINDLLVEAGARLIRSRALPGSMSLGELDGSNPGRPPTTAR